MRLPFLAVPYVALRLATATTKEETRRTRETTRYDGVDGGSGERHSEEDDSKRRGRGLMVRWVATKDEQRW